MNKKVYISGAIAHYDLEERRQAFDQARALFELEGLRICEPVQERAAGRGALAGAHAGGHRPLLGCDYIYMLQGWELSKGAKLELDVASSCGIKVLFE